MIVAKRPEVRNELQKQIRRRAVSREYLALAGGRPESRSGTIEAPLGRDTRERTRMSVQAAGRAARTHFEVERFLEGGTWHGCGSTPAARIRSEPTSRRLDIRCAATALTAVRPLGLQRQFLHSARLALLLHPAPGPLEVESPLPPDLAARRAEAGAEAD